MVAVISNIRKLHNTHKKLPGENIIKLYSLSKDGEVCVNIGLLITNKYEFRNLYIIMIRITS